MIDEEKINKILNELSNSDIINIEILDKLNICYICKEEIIEDKYNKSYLRIDYINIDKIYFELIKINYINLLNNKNIIFSFINEKLRNKYICNKCLYLDFILDDINKDILKYIKIKNKNIINKILKCK